MPCFDPTTYVVGLPHIKFVNYRNIFTFGSIEGFRICTCLYNLVNQIIKNLPAILKK